MNGLQWRAKSKHANNGKWTDWHTPTCTVSKEEEAAIRLILSEGTQDGNKGDTPNGRTLTIASKTSRAEYRVAR